MKRFIIATLFYDKTIKSKTASLSIFKCMIWILFFIVIPIEIYAVQNSSHGSLPDGTTTTNDTIIENYYTTKLYPNWFNPLGGLANYYGGYAVLSIDRYGGISIQDYFYSKDKEISKRHWITIDEVYRAKDSEKEVFIRMTFHYIDSRGKEDNSNRGNGFFKFPPGNHQVHLVNGIGANTIIDDEYAKEHHIGEVLEKTFIKRKKGDILVIRSNGKTIKGRRGLQLELGDTIRTLDGTAEIVLGGRVIIKIKPHTEIIIPKVTPSSGKTNFIKMTYGVIMAHTKREIESFKTYVPQAICGVRGTKFEVSHDPKAIKSCVRVFEHSVWFSDLQKRKTVIVHEGEKSCVVDGGLPSSPQPFAKNKKAAAQNKFLFHGKTQDNFAASLSLNIAKDGTISGIYSEKGSKFQPGKPCHLSARIPFKGRITSNGSGAKGVLAESQEWCEGSNIKQTIPAETFVMYYQKGKGLILEFEDTHYRLLFNKPSINPFKTE